MARRYHCGGAARRCGIAGGAAGAYDVSVRRLYSEHVPFERIDAAMLDALRARDIELAVAVQPGGLGSGLEELCARVRDANVTLVLWPMLDDAEGRWLSAGNVARFEAHTREVLARVPHAQAVLLDLEPPIDWTRSVLAGAARVEAGRGRLGSLAPVLPRAWRTRPARAVDDETAALHSIAEFARNLRDEGFILEATVPPVLAFGDRWERWLGTPLRALACERVEVMAYTSLFEGYSYGAVDRVVARDLLARIARRCAASGRAVALGVIGGGALGDERAYRSVDELSEDVAQCLACGVERLSLYALDGIMARGDRDAWLDAFVASPTHRPPRVTRRGRALTWATSALGDDET